MDYKTLLKKYIRLIVWEESIDYLSHYEMPWTGRGGLRFSDSELEELHKLSKETVREMHGELEQKEGV